MHPVRRRALSFVGALPPDEVLVLQEERERLLADEVREKWAASGR